MTNNPVPGRRIALALLLMVPTYLWAEAADEEVVELETFTTEEEVEDDLGLLPTEPNSSVFGFNKSLLETPRSASAVSIETLERFGITDIDDIVALSPGSFTQSFFGVAGSLDVRGTPGETYFNGIRRLDNPGNYPTPIGASDQIVIVRGPASPIFGPAKIGGYLNFVPKSARAETGQYLPEPTGELSFTIGNWDKSILTAEVGGPGKIGGKDFGYYLYAEVEDSGSYYDNTATEQTILQASFNMDLTDNTRASISMMYHDYEGNQVAGWNRITQDLIDNGTYVTGDAFAFDTDGDGSISHTEYFTATVDGNSVGALFQEPAADAAATTAQLLATPEIGLDQTTVGVSSIDGNQVLVAPDDTLDNEVFTLYADIVTEYESGLSITNKFFFEEYDNLNENAYGFSQFHETWVAEYQLIFGYDFVAGPMSAAFQLSPQLRHTDFEHGDDFINEFFDRRDLTGPSTARDRRLLSTRSGVDYANYDIGEYTDLGLAFLADLDFEFGLNILAGGRFDRLEVDSRVRSEVMLPFQVPANLSASDTDDGFSWTISASYEFPFGLIPYVTLSEQRTILAGQGAEIGVNTISSGNALQASELEEFGLKGNFLDGRLYVAVAFYEQERTDFSAQNVVTNQTAETEGIEFEARWLVTDDFSLTASFTDVEVRNLTTQQAGGNFSFLGAEDVPGVDPTLFYGGTLGGFVPAADVNPDGVRAGVPENIITLTGTYDFGGGWAGSATVIDVEEAFSGYTNRVELPSYTLINAGISYTADNWSINVTGKNLTDEEYFRANFPNLFGGAIVLPELPRHFQGTFTYKF